MTLPSNTTHCLVCASRLVKNGVTGAGTQRWLCRSCGASSVRKRPDVTARHQFEGFLGWLMGKASQTELAAVSDRTFRRTIAWCWDVEPALPPVTERHDVVIVDGIYVGSWCLLIAITEQLDVLAWQWCARESTAAWTALLERIPAPTVIVTDGGTGLASAVRAVWPHTTVQRCLFHLQMNVRRHLTLNPRTDAGKHLLKLAWALSNIHTIDDAITWQQHLNTWWQAYGHLTEERSRNGYQTWYTHERLRKAWYVLATQLHRNTLFTWLTHGNARTTSPLEGGINNGIRTVLRNHRGMSEPHMKRAAEWFLTLKTIPINQAHQFIKASQPGTAVTKDDEPETINLYGTATSAEEGLWNRSGWAGRS